MNVPTCAVLSPSQSLMQHLNYLDFGLCFFEHTSVAQAPGLQGGVPCAVHALCARCAKTPPNNGHDTCNHRRQPYTHMDGRTPIVHGEWFTTHTVVLFRMAVWRPIPGTLDVYSVRVLSCCFPSSRCVALQLDSD